MLTYIDNLTDKLEDVKRLIFKLHQIAANDDSDHPRYIGLDTETTGLDPFTSQVLLVQLKVGDEVFVLNRGALGLDFITNIVRLIAEGGIICIGHNVKFDAKMIREDTGIWIKNLYDTMIAETVITCGLGGKYPSLAELVRKYCGIELDKESRLEFVQLNQKSVFTERQITYSAYDVLYLDDIFNGQMDTVVSEDLARIIDLEMKVLPVVMKMEREGITLDVEHWNALTRSAEIKRDELAKQLTEIIFSTLPIDKYKNAYDFAKAVAIPIKKSKRERLALESIVDPACILGWAKESFNIGSPGQLQAVLNLLGMDIESTNEKILNKLPKTEVVDVLLEYRDYKKRVETYGDNVVQAINPVTGKIHTDFNQLGTATGRFSSSGSVNMQNIPTHNGYREGFVARPGYSFMAMDYSQQEYRLAGALSKEPIIADAYKSGYDMHTASAAKRYGKDFKDVTKDERNKGKGINFTVLYGGTEWALGKNLDVPTEEAKGILNDFFKGYPILAAFKNAVENKIVELGYSITPLGRKRYFKPLSAFATPREVVNDIAKKKREGFNLVIQGGGADVTKLALVDMDASNPFGDKFYIILQVHDEIVAEVHDSVLEEAEVFMRKCMVDAFQPFLRDIPAVVDCKVSKRWTKS